MKNIHKSNITLLKERVRRNYEDYRDEAIEYGGEYVFVLATEVVAVKEVYSYLTDDDYVGEDEAAFLLKFENPLKALADEWETHKIIENDDFCEFIENFIERGSTEPHVAVTIADELREKYGEDTPLNTACLLELVALGKKLFGIVEADSADTCGFDEFEEFIFEIDEEDEDNFNDDDFYGEHGEYATKGGGF